MRNFDIALGRDKDYDILLPRRAYEVEMPIYTLPFRRSISGWSRLILKALARCSPLRKFLSSKTKNALWLSAAAPSPHMAKHGRAMSQVALHAEGNVAAHAFRTAQDSAVQLGCDACVLDRPLAAGGNTIALWQSGAELMTKRSLGTPQTAGLELFAGAPETEYVSSMHANSRVELGVEAEKVCVSMKSEAAGSAVALGIPGRVCAELLRLQRLYELDDAPISDMDDKMLRELDYVRIEGLDDMPPQNVDDR